MTEQWHTEITVFEKHGGVLSKRIWLDASRNVCSDGSACVMASGTAHRQHIADIGEFAAVLEKVQSHEAIALGALRADLPDKVQIVTKQRLNGQFNTIARTAADIHFRKAAPALALIDFDTKGMPPQVASEMQRRGGFWPTLLSILPSLGVVSHLIRLSTSAGLFRTDTGQKLPGSNGLHAYLSVQDGADIERFVRTLHERCWLAGLGWKMVGAGGQLLERSIVDRMVGAPERLVFEGDPILEPPVGQDRESRRPMVVDGPPLDTITACPPLTIVEKAKLCALKAKEAHRLAPESAKARTAFIAERAKCLAKRTGMSEQAAVQEVARQCDGILWPSIELLFDDNEFAGCTVGDVLNDPGRFEGATLADPIEGVDYGRCKARIMRRADGTPWIHSFAHGHTIYELRHNIGSVRAAMKVADDSDVVKVFLRLVAIGDLGKDEIETLRNEAANRSGTTKPTISKMLREAEKEQKAKNQQEQCERRLAERDDPRPVIPVPATDAPFVPIMTVLNDVLGAIDDPHPPGRDIDGNAVYTSKVVVPDMHAFSVANANADEEADQSLPAPEQWLIRRMNEMQLAELIERHIDFVDEGGRSVHLPACFVRHYLQRDDDALPTIVAVSMLPLVLADGHVLSENRFDRLRGVDFRIQSEVFGCVPRPGSVTDDDVSTAMTFLTDQWLVDVAANYASKCTIIAAALTLIERSLLDQRPVFSVTAGRRGGGKTTTLAMLIRAVTGISPAAAAWSNDEEERRKALFSYFLCGVPYILWDNIKRGTQITCPHIEKSCTAAYYSDRKLGVSEMVATAASAVHFFTGNNISLRGDLASRGLEVRLEVDRHDPENRKFTHPDPIRWTDAKRAEILAALYTILLGNPTLKRRRIAPMKTRFKMWYRLVGSAVEHAAKLAADRMEPGAYEADDSTRPSNIDFQQLFLSREDDEEDSTSLADALAIMAERWPMTFGATDVATLVNKQTDQQGATLREFLCPGAPPFQAVSPISVGKQLKNHIDEPVKCGDRTLILRAVKDAHEKQSSYYIERKAA